MEIINIWMSVCPCSENANGIRIQKSTKDEIIKNSSDRFCRIAHWHFSSGLQEIKNVSTMEVESNPHIFTA